MGCAASTAALVVSPFNNNNNNNNRPAGETQTTYVTQPQVQQQPQAQPVYYAAPVQYASQPSYPQVVPVSSAQPTPMVAWSQPPSQAQLQFQQQPVQQQPLPVAMPVAAPVAAPVQAPVATLAAPAASVKAAPVEAEAAAAARSATPDNEAAKAEEEAEAKEEAAVDKEKDSAADGEEAADEKGEDDAAESAAADGDEAAEGQAEGAGEENDENEQEDNAEAPPSVHSGLISAHSHPLHYFPSRYRGNYVCNVCRGSGSGPAYACDQCGFDAHITCFEKGMEQAKLYGPGSNAVDPFAVGSEHQSPNHAHPLHVRWTSERGAWSCDACKGSGSGNDRVLKSVGRHYTQQIDTRSCSRSNSCKPCGWDCHIDCLNFKPKPPSPPPAAARPQVVAASVKVMPAAAAPHSNANPFAMFDSPAGGGNGFDWAAPPSQQRLQAAGGGGAAGGGFSMASQNPLLMQLGTGSSNRGSYAPVDATKIGQKFESPLHGHAVDYMQCTWSASLMSQQHSYDCSVCGNQGAGAVLWCGPCNFAAHPDCYFVDPYESPPAMVAAAANSASATVARSPQSDEQDLQFRMRSTRCSSVHPHPLQYCQTALVSLEGMYVCRVCQGKGYGVNFSCPTCALHEYPYSCHVQCFKDDGPGSDVFLAQLLGELSGKQVAASHAAIVDFARKEGLQTNESATRRTALQLFTAIAAFPYLKTGFTHPKLGVKAAEVWNRTNEKDAAHRNDLLYPLAASFSCDTDENAKKPLPDSLKMAVFLDLYKLHGWSVDDRFNTDMNAVVWQKILATHASGAGFDSLQADGILVTPIDDIPGPDCAFMTHRWNMVQGIGGMSLSFFQTFTYHMAVASGYKPEVKDNAQVKPLWVWLDYLSVPQASWNSSREFSADEIKVRQRLNVSYIQWVGLNFGLIAQKSAFFLNYVPAAFEHNDPISTIQCGHQYHRIVELLQSFNTKPDFLLQPKHSLMAPDQNWDPVDELQDWRMWQDRSYSTRIWCVAEYSSVYLAGLGDRINGADHWFYVLLPIITGDDKIAARFLGVKDSYYTADCLERCSKNGFGAWQDFNPQVTRREDPFRPKILSSGQICQHFLSIEGLITALAPAIATVKSDVPLVTDTLYRSILKTAWGEEVSALPDQLRGIRNFILRQGRCNLPELLDEAKDGDLKKDFLRAFESESIFSRYITYLGQYVRQGFNSLMFVDLLLVWSAILQLPAPVAGATPALVGVDDILKPMPRESIPRGYRNAKYAYTWLNRTLDIPHRLITQYFMPSYSSNGLSALIPITQPIPFQFEGAQQPITTSYVQYLTASHDAHDAPLSSFSTLNASPYQLLYKVKCSYTSTAGGINQAHVVLDGAVALPRSAYRLPNRFDLSPSTAHSSVELLGQRYGLMMFTTVWPMEREFDKDRPMQCKAEGVPQPMWAMKNHAKEFKFNAIAKHSNV